MHGKNLARTAAAAMMLSPICAALADEPLSAQDPCNFHASMPLLERGVYDNYTYAERAHDAATESARLAAGVRIEIVSSGCVDSSARTYTLTYTGAALPERTLAQWAGVAQHELGALRLVEGAKDETRGIVAYAGDVAATRETGDKVVRCADDTVPIDGECAWRTGGSRGIEVRREPGGVRVILIEESSR